MKYPRIVSTILAMILWANFDPAISKEEPVLTDTFSAIYSVSGEAMTITNGTRFFNRPLYGDHMPCVVMAGERPQIRLIHDPVDCGTFMAGLLNHGVGRWAHQSSWIETRFHPGWVEWVFRDDELPGRTGHLEVRSLAGQPGMVVRLRYEGLLKGDQVVWGYGAAAPLPENVSTGMLWAYDPTLTPALTGKGIDPANCKGNEFSLENQGFTFTPPPRKSQPASPRRLVKVDCSLAARMKICDGTKLEDLASLVSSEGGNFPFLTGIFESSNTSLEAVWRVSSIEEGTQPPDLTLAQSLTLAVERIESLSNRIVVKTPDPAFDLGIQFSVFAMDGPYYPPLYVHGAMAWNMPFPGWRTLYGPTAYGWHDRVLAEGRYYTGSQVIKSDKVNPKADPSMGLSQQADDSRFYGRGHIQQHQAFYNMQSVHFDMLVHAWRWTGSEDIAKVLKDSLPLHIEWARDCFDPDGDGVYESYINTWATDSVWYNGGDTAHETAYAYTSHLAAADLDENTKSPESDNYRVRSAHIQENMLKSLWIPEKGYLGEYREALGQHRLHEDSSLYTIFMPIDAGMLTSLQAAQNLYYTEWGLERVKSPLGGERCWTSNWVPYVWSVRELYPGENYHLALAYFQTGLAEEGWNLLKGNYREWMYNSVVPGNLGHESCGTDFTDISSTFCRLVVEGLFGFRPDRPKGIVRICPGFPPEWKRASIKTPDFGLAFKEEAGQARYEVTLGNPAEIEFHLPVRASRVQSVKLNGIEVPYETSAGFGQSLIIIKTSQVSQADVEILWEDPQPFHAPISFEATVGQHVDLKAPGGKILAIEDPCAAFTVQSFQGDHITGQIGRKTGHKLVFARVQYGELEQWQLYKIHITDPEAEKRRVQETLQEVPTQAKWEPIDISANMNGDIRKVYQQEYLTPRVQTCSVQLGTDGFSPWTYYHWKPGLPQIDLSGVKNLLSADGLLRTSQGVPFRWNSEERNVAFVSQYDNWPDEITFPVGKSGQTLWFLVCGTTNNMQTRIANGVFHIRYQDGTEESLELIHPFNYWTLSDHKHTYLIERDRFALPDPLPTRIQLGTNCRAMLLNRSLKPGIPVESVRLEALSQEVVIGLMGLTVME